MSIENKQETIQKEKRPVFDYLKRKNETLINDYRTPESSHSESCLLIAIDIAKILLKEGKKSYISSIRGKRLPDGLNNESLVPTQYKGREKWGGHVVCIYDDLVYDPMFSKPIPLEEYPQKAFGSEIEIKVIVPENEIEEFVNR